MQVVGYYQANELCDDMELGPFGKTIAEMAEQRFGP